MLPPAESSLLQHVSTMERRWSSQMKSVDSDGSMSVVRAGDSRRPVPLCIGGPGALSGNSGENVILGMVWQIGR
jgi:hypothetical protein